MSKWESPKMNWRPGDGIGADDLNRIERNIHILNNKIVLSGKDTPLIWRQRVDDYDWRDVVEYDNLLTTITLPTTGNLRLVLARLNLSLARTSNSGSIDILVNNNVVKQYDLRGNADDNLPGIILGEGTGFQTISLRVADRPAPTAQGSVKLVDLWYMEICYESI